VPASVVQRGPNGTYAYVVTPVQTAEMRPLTVERIEDGTAIIASGLHSGEKVITEGHYRVQPGGKLKIPDASTGPDSGRKRTAEAAVQSKP
jgi:multidrug efflux system membrane fusion protein